MKIIKHALLFVFMTLTIVVSTVRLVTAAGETTMGGDLFISKITPELRLTTSVVGDLSRIRICSADPANLAGNITLHVGNGGPGFTGLHRYSSCASGGNALMTWDTPTGDVTFSASLIVNPNLTTTGAITALNGNVTVGADGRGLAGVVTAPNSNVVGVGTNGRVYPGLITFAALGAPANGGLIYCSDCVIANPCTGGGTGAIAVRLNATWVCNAGNVASSTAFNVYDSVGVLQTNAHAVRSSVALLGGTATVTLTGASVFTSTSTYSCVPDDSTTVSGANIVNISGTQFTVTGISNNTIRYICIGN